MKILVGYGSKSDQPVLEHARHYAGLLKAEVYVVTSITQAHDVTSKDIDKMVQANKELESVTEYFGIDNIGCTTRLLVSEMSSGENIVKYATDEKVDLILIGVKRRSKVGKLIFGSTAQYVILQASCPVLTVK